MTIDLTRIPGLTRSSTLSDSEIVALTKEIAALNPRVAQEMLRQLEADMQSRATGTPRKLEFSSTPSLPDDAARTSPDGASGTITPTEEGQTEARTESPKLLPANTPSSTDVSRTIDVTTNSAFRTVTLRNEGHSQTDATEPPGNSVRKRFRNSRARKKSRPRPAAIAPAPPNPNAKSVRLARHQAHCGICGHDLQDEIDQAFTNWESVGTIEDEYNLDRRAVYRHAHALGLFDKRERNIRRALSHIIQTADAVCPSADSVVRAVRIFAHMNARSEWVNPPTHVVFATSPSPSNLSGRPEHVRTAQTVTPRQVRKRLKR